MLQISKNVSLPESNFIIKGVLSQGPGGQKINKTASAVQLFFDIKKSHLPEFYKSRLLKLNDRRITKEGVIIIQSRSHRSFENNKTQALEKLRLLIRSVLYTPKKRIPTRVTKSSNERRLNSKKKHSQLKRDRNSFMDDN